MNLLLSAHSDDVALSIGGHLLCRDLRPAELLTVFQRGSHMPLAIPDASLEVATALRIVEDLDYCSRVGLRHRGLGLPDATARGYSLEMIFELDDPAQDPRADELTGAVRQALEAYPKGTAVWAPLAIGCHIDHLLLTRAVLDWRPPPGVEVVFYEDLPYAGWEPLGAVDEQVSTVVAGVAPHVVDLGSRLDDKLELARTCYRSQVTAQDLDLIALHARRIVPGRAVERVWRRPGDSRTVCTS